MSALEATSALSDAEFQHIVGIAAADAGLAIPASKKSLVQSRVTRRMRNIGLSRYSDYLARLQDDTAERSELICVLTTNVSHFYRESHHFEHLAEHVFPTVKNRLRVWSAGCSNGQEPYTLAFEILKAIPNAANKDILVLATDIDPQVLEKAKSGAYTEAELDGVPKDTRNQIFNARQDGTFAVRPEIAKLVRFRQLNLNAAWPMRGTFEVILCRNVVIYFNDDTQQSLWPRFAKSLSPDGLLMLGHSERIHPLDGSGFENIGVTTYRKI